MNTNQADENQPLAPAARHTPEPWRIRGTTYGYTKRDVLGPPHDDGGDYAPICKSNCDENAARIVACVNACAGLSDPAAELARLREQNERMRDALQRALPFIPHTAEGASDVLHPVLSQARAALSKVGDK